MNRNKRNKAAILLTLLGVIITLFIAVFIFIQPTAADSNIKPTSIPSITPTNAPTPISEDTSTISPTAAITIAPTPSEESSHNTPTPSEETSHNTPTPAEETSHNAPTPAEETSHNTPTPSVNPTVKLHFINVNQGDSILIEDNDHFMLIDAGINEKGDTVKKYLKKLGVEKLDYVIGTHPHNDHIGGLDTVINAFKVDNVLLPDVSIDSENYEDVLEAIADKNLIITRPTVGDNYTLGNASFVIISPNASSYEALNDYSIGIKLTYGSNSFLLAGDIQAVSEAEILENGIDLSADVLKLSHHGSSTSNTISFLDKVDPKYAVISVGKGNKYEHPHSATMQAVNERAINLYRTDKQGSIVFTTDGKIISVNVEPYAITSSDMTSDAAEKAAIAKGY